MLILLADDSTAFRLDVEKWDGEENVFKHPLGDTSGEKSIAEGGVFGESRGKGGEGRVGPPSRLVLEDCGNCLWIMGVLLH